MAHARFKLVLLVTLSMAFDSHSPEELSRELRSRIQSADGLKARVGKETLLQPAALFRFYESRNFRPAWVGRRDLSDQAHHLLKLIREAGLEGLRPSDYHVEAIQTILETISRNAGARSALLRADLEFLLTDAFFSYASDLSSGRVDPRQIHPRWIVLRRKQDLAQMLEGALHSGQVYSVLAEQRRHHLGYEVLRRALAEYRQKAVQGSWPVIPPGPKLQVEDRDERVPLLRRRLLLAGDLPSHVSSSDPLHFDRNLGEGVRHFQARHGLAVDSVVGPATLRALNVPLSTRLRQIELNMERWRWLPERMGGRFLLVNLPAFELKALEDETVVLKMRTIVGRRTWPTPVFSDAVIGVILNPSWDVPSSIARAEILPQLRKNPEYLRVNNMKVIRGRGEEARVVDSRGIDWSAVDPASLDFAFRQESGGNNPLGQLKFKLFQNDNYYLHDTPQKVLFEKTRRTFSHGCLRVEKSLELAGFLLGQADLKNLTARIQKGTELTFRLGEPVPLYVFYWTSWVENDGMVHFREDVYQHDQRLEKLLRK